MFSSSTPLELENHHYHHHYDDDHHHPHHHDLDEYYDYHDDCDHDDDCDHHDPLSKVEAWFQDLLQSAPAELKNGFFVSYLEFYDLQHSLQQGTISSSLLLALSS